LFGAFGYGIGHRHKLHALPGVGHMQMRQNAALCDAATADQRGAQRMGGHESSLLD
jgi:hypothetical protein